MYTDYKKYVFAVVHHLGKLICYGNMGPLSIISSFDFVYSLKRIDEISPWWDAVTGPLDCRTQGLRQAVDYLLPPFVRAQIINIHDYSLQFNRKVCSWHYKYLDNRIEWDNNVYFDINQEQWIKVMPWGGPGWYFQGRGPGGNSLPPPRASPTLFDSIMPLTLCFSIFCSKMGCFWQKLPYQYSYIRQWPLT